MEAILQIFRPRPDILFVALPFEIFTSTGMSLTNSFESIGFRKEKVFVVGYANGTWAYLPPSDAVENGGYEVEDGPIWYGLSGWYPADAEAKVRSKILLMVEYLTNRPAGG